MSSPSKSRRFVHRAQIILRFWSRRKSRNSVSPQGSPTNLRTERCCPHISSTSRAAERESVGVAAEEPQQSESATQCQMQNKSVDTTSLVLQEEMWSLNSLARSAAAPVGSLLVTGGDLTETQNYIMAFLNEDAQREEASKLRFLASIRTLCRAWLQGVYLPSFTEVSRLVQKTEVLQDNEAPHAMDAMMWQQAKLAFAAMSKEYTGLLHEHLGPLIRDICCLEPEEQSDSPSASLDAQIMETLDSLLEVVTRGTSLTSSNEIMVVILKVLGPLLTSPQLCQRRRAMGSLVGLSQHLRPSSMLKDYSSPIFFGKTPLPFLGQLMGVLTLCYAEKDTIISHGAAQALSVFHRAILLRRGNQASGEESMLQLDQESACTFWPKGNVDPEMLFGSSFLRAEKDNFILAILQNVGDPRVADIQLVARILEGVLSSAGSETITVQLVVQNIHTQLRMPSKMTAQEEDILKSTFLQLASLDLVQVTAALMQESARCHNTTLAMWNMLALKPSLLESVLRILLVLSAQCTRVQNSSGRCNCHDLIAMASAMREIFLVPSSRPYVQLLIDELFVAVVFQIFCSLEGMQKGCCYRGSMDRKIEHPSLLSTTVSTAQALFQCLGSASLVEDIGRQGGWDMLLCPETYHDAVAVLTRVLRREVPECCAAVSEQAVTGLLQEWVTTEVASLTVFVELLDYTNLEHVDSQVVSTLEVRLRSKDILLRRLAVQSLAKISVRPKKAEMLHNLLPEVMKLLADENSEVTMAALTVLSNVLPLLDRKNAGPVASELVKLLLPLSESESSGIRELSMLLWRRAVEVAGQSSNRQAKKHVQFFHRHDKEHHGARVGISKTSHYATAQCGSEAPSVEDQEKLQVIDEGAAGDDSLSISSPVAQAHRDCKAELEKPPSRFRLQALRSWLRRAWRRARAAISCEHE